MKQQNKNKRLEQRIDKIKYKHLDVASEYFDFTFRKGTKKYAEVLAIFAIAFTEGMEAGKEVEQYIQKYNPSKYTKSQSKHKTKLQWAKQY